MIVPCANSLKSVYNSNQNVAFSGYSNNAVVAMRRAENIPDYLSPAYDGYCGRKKFSFPTSVNLALSDYPDVTSEFLNLKTEALDVLFNAKNKTLGFLRAMNLFRLNLSTGKCWDTKFLPEFPGRDVKGQTQYGKYKDRIVSANYLSNNIYGQMCAAAGLPLSMAKTAAKVYSVGALELIVNGRLPNRKAMQFRDPLCDQLAIESGYLDFLRGNPWGVKGIDPAMPHL